MTLPASMNIVEIAAPGGPEVLKPATRPVPAPGAAEVLVKVAAAGVNRPDVAQRKGLYPPPPGASDIPGLEVAGTVVALGAGVTEYAIGDAVCALVSGGGYAEYAVCPVPQTLPVPRGLSLIEAASVPETFFTVWTNMVDRGHLAAGESFLVHGGSSGIGTTAIQLARARGARVSATAGSAEKVAACERLGAERGIDYRREDFVDIVKQATGGKGVDVILDIVGGDYLPRNIASLATEGRLLQVAVQGGAKAEINLGLVLMRRLTLTGSTLRPRRVAQTGAIAEALRREVWPLLEAGTVRPVIDRTFPLAEAARAHAVMEESSHIGKLVLTL